LKIHGDNPRKYTTLKLRQFIVTQSSQCKVEVNKNRVTAIRMFLLFLIATNRCDSNLENSIPTVAHWRLSTLPKYLSSTDIERIIDCCECTTNLGVRNYAIILLLARLGLRSSEVANLNMNDVDWPNGTITLMSKNRREAKLPLPQDVGDALLHYISSARPDIDSESIFIRVIAPRERITRRSVYCTAAAAIRRAGIIAPSYGAHIFRHSVATSLLRQGCSLQTIGVWLRHESVETTAIYAKVDTILLQQVSRPWPGALP
jgi:site-specific recombinase XerD